MPVKKLIKTNPFKRAQTLKELKEEESGDDSDAWMDFIFDEASFDNEIKDINEMLS